MLFTDKTFAKCLQKIADGEIKSVLFAGSNYGLATIFADEIVKMFKPDEKVILDFQNNDGNFGIKLHSLLGNDFFSAKKIIKVYNINAKVVKDIKFLDEETINDKIIIFFGNELEGKSALKTFFEKGNSTACVNCYDDDKNTATEAIIEFFNTKKINISNDAILAMANMLHGDRGLLLNECEKLSLYCNGNEITSQDVNEAITNEQSANPSHLADLILSGDTKTAFKEFELFEKEDTQIIMFIRLFLRAIEEILDIKNRVANGEAVEMAIKSKFIFWKRIPLVKKIVASTPKTLLDNYITIALQTEKRAKIYGNEIAKKYFIRNALLYNVR